MIDQNGNGKHNNYSSSPDVLDQLPTIDLGQYHDSSDDKLHDLIPSINSIKSSIQDQKLTPNQISDQGFEFGEDQSIVLSWLLKIFHQLSKKKFTFWAKGFLGLLAFSLILSIVQAIIDQPKIESSKPQDQNSRLLALTSPAILGGITENTPSEEALARYQSGLQDYERLLTDSLSKDYQALINAKASEMSQNALIEEQSGQFLAVDPTNTIQISECPRAMRIQKCVLFRYALEGIAAYNQGMATQDLTRARIGSDRFTSALIALNPPSQPVDQSTDYDPTLAGMLQTVRTYFELSKITSPVSAIQNISTTVSSPSNQQPSNTLVEQNKPVLTNLK